MIHDGYTKRLRYDGALVEYRPMLKPERMAVLRRAAHAKNIADVYREAVLPHLLYCETAITEFREDFLVKVMGLGRGHAEREEADNLYHGTVLWCRYPHLERVDCATCRKYQFDPLTGYFSRRGPAKALVERPPGDSLLCETREGCPKGTWEKPRSLTPRNRAALAFDLECRAVGEWPDDAIVRRNARIIGCALRRGKHGLA